MPDASTPDSGPPVDMGTEANVDAHVACNGMCSGTTPHCLAMGTTETCVGCVDEMHCVGMASTPHCDTMGTHTCVACLSDMQCPMAATAACNTTSHACEACTTSTQCAHLTATPVCVTTGAMMGTCAQCNSNADCTGANMACDTTMHSCVSVTPMSKFACDACLSDAECQTGQLCVPMSYHGNPVGTYCVWRLDATGAGAPNGDCTNTRPARGTMMATSTDSVSAMVCELSSSTCTALRHHRDTCSPATSPASSDMCGTNMDGFCRHEGSVTQCTIGCSSNVDCPCTDGTCASQYTCTGGFCDLTATCNWDMAMRTCH